MAIQPMVFPGEEISTNVLPIPSDPNRALKLGPGLRHTPPSTITATLAGPIGIDYKKNAIWVEGNSGRVRKFYVGDVRFSKPAHFSSSTFPQQAT